MCYAPNRTDIYFLSKQQVLLYYYPQAVAALRLTFGHSSSCGAVSMGTWVELENELLSFLVPVGILLILLLLLANGRQMNDLPQGAIFHIDILH